MKQDRLTVLSEMRPQTSLDVVWNGDEQKVLRERILSDRTGPAHAGPKRSRRVALAGALALSVLAVPGVAAAVGNGIKPQAFFDAYTNWNNNPAGTVDPKTAQRVAAAPGPDGGTFSVIAAKNSDGLTCVTPIFETSTSAKAVLPDNFEGGFDFCRTEPNARPFGVAGLDVQATAVLWHADAGDAVRAELRMPTGETYPVVLAEGYFFGWYPLPYRAPEDAPTLIGYASDGGVVGEAKI